MSEGHFLESDFRFGPCPGPVQMVVRETAALAAQTIGY